VELAETKVEATVEIPVASLGADHARPKPQSERADFGPGRNTDLVSFSRPDVGVEVGAETTSGENERALVGVELDPSVSAGEYRQDRHEHSNQGQS